MAQNNGALVTDFLAKNKVLISYVRNSYGFKKGLVIAFLLSNSDKEPKAKELRMGWSLVNNNEDVVWKYLRPDQLPIVQRKELVAARLKPQEKKTEQLKRLEVKAGRAVDRLLRQKLQVKIPKFEKRLALYYAIDRALQGKGITAEQILAAKKYKAELRDCFLLPKRPFLREGAGLFGSCMVEGLIGTPSSTRSMSLVQTVPSTKRDLQKDWMQT